jgi:hypothetical protein
MHRASHECTKASVAMHGIMHQTQPNYHHSPDGCWLGCVCVRLWLLGLKLPSHNPNPLKLLTHLAPPLQRYRGQAAWFRWLAVQVWAQHAVLLIWGTMHRWQCRDMSVLSARPSAPGAPAAACLAELRPRWSRLLPARRTRVRTCRCC